MMTRAHRRRSIIRDAIGDDRRDTWLCPSSCLQPPPSESCGPPWHPGEKPRRPLVARRPREIADAVGSRTSNRKLNGTITRFEWYEVAAAIQDENAPGSLLPSSRIAPPCLRVVHDLLAIDRLVLLSSEE